jgi:uncharacterized membrane protein (UPF0127 family)
MFNFRKQIWFFLLLVFLSIVVLLVIKNLKDGQVLNRVGIGGTTINVVVADTPAEQEQGLSGHSPLAAGDGMLFVFKAPALYGFWMKDMLFPLDIIWISADHKITYIEKSLQPSTYPETFAPKLPSQYVLEVIAGTADKNHWTVGEDVSF